jgi:DNA-binding MarR family transcriptional regulator
MDQTVEKLPALECAVEFLELLPLIMGSLQCEMRRDPATGLTMGQFRVLSVLNWHGVCSVSQIADFLELGLPATSKIIDGMVSAGMLLRRGDPSDRRRVLLEISSVGRNELLATRAIAHNHLANLLSPLSEPDRARLIESLRSMRPLFVKLGSGGCPGKFSHA